MKRILPALALLLSAFLLFGPAGWTPGQLPGDPGLRYGPVTVNLHWQIHERGISSYIADDLHGYPYRTDRMTTDGIPLDAFLSAPLCWILGTPKGMWLWVLGLLWAQGLAAGALAARYWDRPHAFLLGGIAYQLSECGLRELGEGRYATVFVGLLLPILMGAALACRRQPLWAWGVGALVGVVGMMDPSLLSVALLLGLGGMWGSSAWVLLYFSAGLAVFGGAPLAWLLSGLGELPSLSMDPWSPALLDFSYQKPVEQVARRIFGWDGVMLGTLLRPLWGLGLAVVVGSQAPARWRLPAVLGLLSALLGLGPYLPGPLVLPAGWLLELPLLQRAWWADRAWWGVSLCASLLLGGLTVEGISRFVKVPFRLDPRLLMGGMGIGLGVEAAALSKSLPFSTIPLPPADSAKILANYADLPMVLLPLPGGRFRPDHFDLLDQISHGRPLAHGTRPPFDLTAPDALLRNWRQNAGLRALAACETGQPMPLTGQEQKDLLHAGLRVVYVDSRYVLADATGQAYLSCVENVLTGWELGQEQAPFRKYEVRTH